MNLIYAKTALYCYPSLGAVIKQIDELVEKKAFASMWDNSPAIFQCEKISNLTCQKVLMIDLKNKVEKSLRKFSEEEKVYFEYKYFRRKDKEFYKDFDFKSRKYFRTQNRLIKEFGKILEKTGIDDTYFEEYLNKIEFFKELVKRVKEHEILSRKNKTLREKEQRIGLTFSARENKRLIERESGKVNRTIYS